MKLTKKQALRKLIDNLDVVYINSNGLPFVVDLDALTLNRQPDDWPEFQRMFLGCKLRGNELLDTFREVAKLKRKVITLDQKVLDEGSKIIITK
jgi:hypothetical protein